MSSIVEVYNLAATRMGAVGRISSPDDNRAVARAISAVFAQQRRAAIRDGAWNFASKRAELAAEYNPDRVVYPWTYAYPAPAECLRFLEVLECEKDAYAYEDGVILSNSAGPLRIRYLIDKPEPADWDEGFAESFGLRIAMRVGRQIGGSAFDLEQCTLDYRASLSAAKRADARENPGPGQAESDWITARWGGHSVGWWRR